MMFELLLDVMDRFLKLRDTNAECAIAMLPSKVSEVWKGLMNTSRKSYNINVFSFRIRNFVTPIIESVRTPARITPYPTGRLFGVAIGVGTKVGFAPPSEPDCQISWIRLSSWWLAFERLAGASPELSGSFSRCLPLPGRPNRLWTRVEGSRTCFCSSPN